MPASIHFPKAHMALAALLAALLLLTAAACGPGEEAKKVDMSKRSKVAMPAPAGGLTYAYLPQYSHSVSYARHHLLVEYLANATGLPVRQVFPDTFDEHVKMVARGEIDISFSNPFVYIRLAREGARAFARVVEPSGSPDFRGQIIARVSDASIGSIEDCKGKRWLAVDPSSAGGYLFALGLFLDNGIRPSDFAEIAFAPGPGGKQEKVVLGIDAGTFDVGSIREGTLDLLAGRLDPGRIRILATTRAYPGWVYAAGPGVDNATMAAVARALERLDIHHPDDAVILETARIRGVIPATDADYDPIRELAARLGKE